MKLAMSLLALTFASTPALAAEVTGARISGTTLTVSVRHGGGCGTHKYELQLQGCAESMPVQCRAKLQHRSRDNCEALLSREATFDLVKLGMTGDYYAGGSLTIYGDNNSRASVRLPALSAPREPSRPSPFGGEVECVTHTGSLMNINERGRLLTLETTGGQKASYKIVKTDAMVLESMPPVYQTTYFLDDGRKVITNFRGESRTGSGNFVRLNGEYSPEFKSCRR